MTGDRPGWAQVRDELAGTIAGLQPEGALTLEAGEAFVQFIRFTRGSELPGPVVLVHTLAGDPGTPVAAALAGAGWAWSAVHEVTGQPEVPAPVDDATAARLADLIVGALRDVHGVADPAALTYTSFNNNGLRPPQLRTVRPAEGQPLPLPDPVTLLPPPSPLWQGWCELLAGGLPDWSDAGLSRLAGERGWQPAPDGSARTYTGGGGETITGSDWDAGYYGHAELSALSVSLPKTYAGIMLDYRRALAGAVRVLGNPPLAGDTGTSPFARWRGTAATLTLSASDHRLVELLVEPTEPRETVIHQRQKWMMTPDEWSPDELWTVHPDVEGPEMRALDGMMFYPHSPAETLEETIEELRSLFRSWAMSLELLHPYASSARWRLRGPGGDMIAEGGFTQRRTTVRFGWRDEYGAPISTPSGGGSVDAVIERVRAALAQAGVTTPAQLRAATWSDTPAERLDAIRLTLRRG